MRVNFISVYDYQEPACNKYLYLYIYISLWIDISISLVHIPRCGIAGSNLILKAISRCFPKRWSTPNIFFSFLWTLLVFASFIQIKWYHIVTWIFISMLVNLSVSSFVYGSWSFPLHASVYMKNKRGVFFSSVFFLTHFNSSGYFIVIKFFVIFT